MKFLRKMTDLKLKVKMYDGDRVIQNFNQEQWDETCIIFQKLVRNIKEEIPDLVITDYCQDSIPYVTMKVDVKDDSEISDEQLVYVFDYLSGAHTDNPVFLHDGEYHVDSVIILEKESEEDFLTRFNQLVSDLSVE